MPARVECHAAVCAVLGSAGHVLAHLLAQPLSDPAAAACVLLELWKSQWIGIDG